jgi:regulator of sigma E protease
MFLILAILAFIVVIGILVTVHELGHYLVARFCGVKVLRFSIGFGQALLLVPMLRGCKRTPKISNF